MLSDQSTGKLSDDNNDTCKPNNFMKLTWA